MTTLAPLPPPAWFLDRDTARLPAWRYPFHLMAIGDGVFVARPDLLGRMAHRSLDAYRRALRKQGVAGAPFTERRTTVCGIPGIVIRRVH